MRGLYAIVDTDAIRARGLDVVSFAGAVIQARPAAVQLRDKRGTARASLALLREMARMAHEASVPLFANDRPDLALLAGCDGVHVGQDDVPVTMARALGPLLRIGLSTHGEEDVRAAPLEHLDYVAVGPVFATSSKAAAAPALGLGGLTALARGVRARRPELPIVAIGGIDFGRAGEVGGVADACAVIGALLPGEQAARPYDEVRRLVQELHATIVEARP